MRRFIFLVVGVYFIFLSTMMVSAIAEKLSMPRIIRFQGKLADANGTPLSGFFNLRFSLYDAPEGGMPLWEETQEDVTLEEGRLDVELGSVSELDLPFNEQYWLGVEVEADGEMEPRFKLTSVPYSMTSGK